MKITDSDLAKLRSHAEFNAMTLEKLDWYKLAAALEELQDRRQKEKSNEHLQAG